MRFFHFFQRNQDLDARVAEARENAATAKEEADLSRERNEEIRETIVKPLWAVAGHNKFAELLRDSLVQGHGNHLGTLRREEGKT